MPSANRNRLHILKAFAPIATALGSAVVGTLVALAGAQPALGTAPNLSGGNLIAASDPSNSDVGGLATDVAYQAFRSGERASYGQVGQSAVELFRSGERAAYGGKG